MARVTLTGVDLTINGERQRSSTTIGAVGAYAAVVATALPDRGVTLTSSYLAADDDIAVSHLAIAPGQHRTLHQDMLSDGPLGETYARACVLDHVAQLHEVLERLTGATVQIDLDARALDTARHAWASAGV